MRNEDDRLAWLWLEQWKTLIENGALWSITHGLVEASTGSIERMYSQRVDLDGERSDHGYPKPMIHVERYQNVEWLGNGCKGVTTTLLSILGHFQPPNPAERPASCHSCLIRPTRSAESLNSSTKHQSILLRYISLTSRGVKQSQKHQQYFQKKSRPQSRTQNLASQFSRH